jgi:hypothetical protein
MKSLFVLLVSLTLVGCANVSTLKISKDQVDGKQLTVLPTGKFNITARTDSGQTTGPGLVGALIALANAVEAANHAKKMTAVIPGAVPPDELINFTSNVIKDNAHLIGNPKSITVAPQSRIADGFIEWFNTENRPEVRQSSDTTAALTLDYGFQELRVVRYPAGMFVEGVLGMRLIDMRTGAIVSRSRVWGVGSLSGERVQAEIDDPDFEKAVQAAIKSYVARLGREALAKMAGV